MGWAVERWGAAELRSHADEVLAVYRAAFLNTHERDPVQASADRRDSLTDSLGRPGLRAVGAVATVDGPTAASRADPARVLGFGYGYTSSPGQWWHDVVLTALTATGRQEWLADCFAVIELHVLPEQQGQGIGRDLLRTLLDGLPHATAALSALDDPASRAIRLYTDEGFAPLLAGFRFPGNVPPYCVLGRRAVPHRAP